MAQAKHLLSDEEDNRHKKKKLKLQQTRNKSISLVDSGISTFPNSFSYEDESPVGIIEKVTLKNFMCHQNLEFAFGNHTNLVTGRNGSGKSAILNGIILALGGKSYLTGRNANIKGFIQTGKQIADISVTLRNVGSDSYRAQDYGPRIIVERQINAEGVSKYKLKGDRGKLISVKHEELINILDAFNIQVDNPVSVLTQEASKNFLLSKDPRKMYLLFFKATQLEKLQEQYDDAQQKIKDSEITLKAKIDNLPEVQKEVKKWEDKLKKLQALDHQEEKTKELENELCWAIVRQAENEELICRQNKEKCKKSVEKGQLSEKELEKTYSDCLDKIRKCKHEYGKEQNAVLGLKGEIDALAQEGNDLSSEIKELQQYISRLEKQFHLADDDSKKLEKDIQKLKQKLQENSMEVLRKRQERINYLEARDTELQSQLRSIGDESASHTAEIEQLKSDFRTKKEEINSYQYKIKNKEEELGRMKSSRSNREFLYGNKMPELLRRIKLKAASFLKLPLGPIGLYLSVREQKWAFAVECCLSPVLQSFCCDNLSDKTVLQRIMREVYGPQRIPNIIVSEFLPQVHNVTSGRVACNTHQTVLDAIICNEPVILNCLIDQVGVERILLIAESSDASNLMMDSPPYNCSSAYTLLGDQVYPQPKYRYYSCRKKPSVQFLQQCFTLEDIRAKQVEIKSLRGKIHDEQSEISSLAVNITEHETQVKICDRCVMEVQRELYHLSQEINDIKEPEDTSDALSIQEEDLAKQQAWREKLKGQIIEKKKELKPKQDEYKAISHQRDSKNSHLKAKEHDIDKLLDQLQNFESHKIDLEERQKKLSLNVKADEKKLEAAEKEWKEANETAMTFLQQALRVCPRINTQKMPSFIEDEIKQLRNILDEEKMLLDKEEINKNYVEKQNKFHNIKNEISRLKNMNLRMKKMINQRWDKFKRMRADITLIVQYAFQTNLKTRNYNGSLEFNHEQATLNVTANPRQTLENNLFKTNSLSGGERSYVTVALLLALCSATEIPFHIFDEYDVFMDSLNKDMSMKIIMEMASKQRSQFIFLSPLNPPAVDESAMIHRMPDPERSIGGKRVCLDEE